LAEYLTTIVGPIVARDLKQETGRMIDGPEDKPTKRGERETKDQ
jgi:hypothetical protein